MRLIPVFFTLAGILSAAEPALRYEQIRKIDVHSHIFEDVPAFNAMFRAAHLRTINVCVPGGDGHLEEMHRIARDLYRKHPDLYPFTATFDVRGVNEPGYAAKVIAWLDTQFTAGAVAVKIWKEFGMEVKDRDGRFLLPDDPRLDPIYAHLAKRGKPLHAHLAEPIDAWRPLDKDSPHYGYYSQNPQWHLYGRPEFHSHAAIIAARDRIMEKHPTLVVVGAHLGSLEHDLEGIAARLERYPNFHIEVAARTRNLARHPSEKVRALFLKYPDRIMYGVDQTWKPYLRPTPPTDQQRQAHVKSLEVRYRADFDYYAGSGEMTYNGRKTEALALPRAVLEKFYHGNAERIFQLAAAKP
ncbi:MAG: amidohydrolase family protein [Verrucomicrobia bacterium]|nr:amidohydrolase family protein [Verrucomicrobiota bacterium]